MKQKLYKIFKKSFGAISVMTVIVLWSLISYYTISYISGSYTESYTETSADTTDDESAEDCNVYGINLHGEIVTYSPPESYSQGELITDQISSDYIYRLVEAAQKSNGVKAIAVEIDSYGGSGVAGEEIMRAFKDSTKPVTVFIRELGLSAAYLAATGAETIFASKFSNVGSIGVTASYLQETDKNKKDGLTYVDLSSAKYKDSGNPSRPISAEERAIMMRDIKIGHENFVNIVAENRNLTLEAVRKLADGSSVMGEQAIKDGLIDKIGSLPDVESYLTKKLGEKANICWQN